MMQHLHWNCLLDFTLHPFPKGWDWKMQNRAAKDFVHHPQCVSHPLLFQAQPHGKMGGLVQEGKETGARG